MRKLLAVLILFSTSAFAGTCGNGYLFSRQFIVPAAKVPNTDQTNFPVSLAFNGAQFFNSHYLPDLATVANGGKIQNTANNSISVSGPADLIFCDASSAGNALKFELTNYSATTGAMESYVEIPTLSHLSSTSFWMFYDNAAVVTSQQDLSMWTDASFVLVCHEPDGTSLNLTCSKSAATPINHGASATAGALGGSALYVAASSQYQDMNSPYANVTLTTEAWVKPTTFSSFQMIGGNLGGGNGFEWWMGNSGADGFLTFETNSGASSGTRLTNAAVILGAWSHVVSSVTGSTIVEYINGSDVSGTTSTPTALGASATNLNIARSPNHPTTLFFDGRIDEFRIASVVRSADWVRTSYNAESSPSDFAIMFGPATGPRIVQYMDCNSAQTVANPCIFLSNVTSGNTLVIISSSAANTQCNGGSINTLFTDTRSTTFTFAALGDQTSGATANACIAFGVLGSSGAETITASNANASPQSMTVYEISGIRSPAVDVTSTAIGGGAGSLSTGSATATTSNSILLCGFSGASSGTQFYTSSLTPTGTSYLNTISAPGGTGSRGGTAAVQFTGSGSKNCTFTFAGPGPTGTASALAVIKYSSTTSKRRQSQIY